MKNESRIAGAGGSDLFPTGTYKISDGTLNLNGSIKKIHSLIAHAGFTLTSAKWMSHGEEVTATLKLLTNALNNGTLVTFDESVHEIVIVGSAMFYFD